MPVREHDNGSPSARGLRRRDTAAPYAFGVWRSMSSWGHLGGGPIGPSETLVSLVRRYGWRA